ncbi:unnamed protein product, partial [marine sediment metagenome]
MKQRRTKMMVSLVVLVGLLIVPTVSQAGDLNPPGPPAPTMKTLDEVEPRIPIGPETTPGDANSLYVITERGSYYLTGNITGVGGKNGIEINSNDVTLDLKGFALIGMPESVDGI